MILSQSFYQRPTIQVARGLLGKRLVRIYRGHRISGLITEVEAYLGEKDRACHTYQGRRTPRTEAMYLSGGHTYIYFIYGMHFCFNVVTRRAGQPEAVLIRAVQPTEGLHLMRRWRGGAQNHHLTDGPAKVAQAFRITKKLNGVGLFGPPLWIERGVRVSRRKIVCLPRIGVDYAGPHAKWPLRFCMQTH